MSRDVLDSSALLASLYGEPGAEAVDAVIRNAVMSAVNAAEVISKLVERGMKADMARSALVDTSIEIIPFDLDQAELVGEIRLKTRSQGLSLGDRACLALAKQIAGKAITSDRAWTVIDDLGVEIVLLRGER